MSNVDHSKLDYSKMLCNIMALPPKKSPLEELDFFKKHKEFHEKLPFLNKTKVLRYICLVYDKGSPLHDAYEDLLKKKMAAADLANFIKEEDGKFKVEIEDMMRCDASTKMGKNINAMILRYVTGFYSAKYSRYILFKEMEFRESNALLNGKSKIDDFNKISKELESVEEELLSGDNALKADLSRYYFEDKLELRPEDIAGRLSNGDQPIILETVESEDF